MHVKMVWMIRLGVPVHIRGVTDFKVFQLFVSNYSPIEHLCVPSYYC